MQSRTDTPESRTGVVGGMEARTGRLRGLHAHAEGGG
jgi:hypothetical protein